MDNAEQSIRDEAKQLQEFLAQPDAYSDPDFADKSRRATEIESIVGLFDEKATLSKQLQDAQELAKGEDAELAELAQAEVPELEEKLSENSAALEDALIPKDPNDGKNVIVEIRAGAGGDEASLFAGELQRMYIRYAESNGLKVQQISESPSEVGGFKEVSFKVSGEMPYKQLKFESGVHRVQRIPVTEKQGRIHTSTCSVAVLPLRSLMQATR